MLIIPGAQGSVRFARRCSNGEGSRINGIGAKNVESQKTSLMEGRENVEKGLFNQGISF